MVKNAAGFGDLQNYTTLKLPAEKVGRIARFGDLQNYTTLKPRRFYDWVP